MIRIANYTDVPRLTLMLRELYRELQPEHALDSLTVYVTEVLRHLQAEKDTVYIAKGGFFIVRDETEPMTPTLNRYNGIRVYITPSYRHGTLLARFYKRLFSDFPDGEILGITEINSEHIKVLDKRHTLIAKVYRLNDKKKESL